MTRTNQFRITDKLPFWLAIPAVIVLAGITLFFLLGFNPSASISDGKTLLISHDPYVNISEDLKEDLETLCENEMEKAGLRFVDCTVSETADGGEIEYAFDPDVSNEQLYTLWSNIENALSADDNLKSGVYSGSVHTNVSQYVYNYIWRAAICAGAALVLAFAYVAVRYRFSMGFSVFIAGVVDTAVMLSLTVILRIPVTTALATAAIFAVLYSVLVSVVSFNKWRKLLKSEEYAALPATDAVEKANAQSLKNVLILGASVFGFSLILAVFGGSAVRAFALPVLCAVAASTFSGTLLTPSLVAAFKAQGVKMQEKKEENKRLAKKKEEEERSGKSNAKKD